MIKFWDRLFLLFFIVGLNLVGDLLMPYGLVGAIVAVILWAIFWSWLDSTFISISYVKELKEKVEKNDNKDSSSSGT